MYMCVFIDQSKAIYHFWLAPLWVCRHVGDGVTVSVSTCRWRCDNVYVWQLLPTVSTPEGRRHRTSLDSRDNGSVVPDSPVYGTASGRASHTTIVPRRERSVIHSVSTYLMKQTYIAMLIFMMVFNHSCCSYLSVMLRQLFLFDYCHVMYKLLYPIIKVRTAPSVSVRVRTRVSVSFTVLHVSCGLLR